MVIRSLGGMRNTLLSALRAIPVCRAAAHILAARMQKARREDSFEVREKTVVGSQAPTSAAGSSGTQGAGVVSMQSASSEAQPSTSGQSSQKGKRLYSQRIPEEAARATKRTRTEVGTMRPPESFADKVTVEKIAIVHLKHPETRLSKETALKIKMELGRRAIRGKDVRITSCYPENGAVVVGCANTPTKSWLEIQFKQLDPFEGIQLNSVRSLVRMCKVTTFVPRTTEAETKDDVILGLKSQSGLDTDHWAVVGGNTTPEGQLLVIDVDGRRRCSYLEVVQEEGRQSQEVFLIIQPSHTIQSPDKTRLEYCSHIGGAAVPTTFSILDSIQRRAIRLIGDLPPPAAFSPACCW
nr:unnamed protein product [Callosobruchus chinensis]